VAFIFRFKNIKIGVNANYLTNILKYLPDAEIRASGLGNPIIFSENGKIVGLLMPLDLD